MTNFFVKGPCCPHVSPRTLQVRHVFSVASLLIMMWRQKVGQYIFIFENSTLSLSFLSSFQEPAPQFFFDMSKKQGGGPRGRGRKRYSDGDGPGRDHQGGGGGHHQGQPKQPRRHRESNQTGKPLPTTVFIVGEIVLLWS